MEQLGLLPDHAVPPPAPRHSAPAHLYTGDCVDVLAGFSDNSIETCVTDPPYGISMMNRNWDHGVPSAHMWKSIRRVIKPGGYLLAFGGSRTFHRLMVNIEDGGWEIVDVIAWIYSTGFPKNRNFSEDIANRAGPEEAERWVGWGNALRPSFEPIVVAVKPHRGTLAANALEHGVAGLNIDGARLSGDGLKPFQRPARDHSTGWHMGANQYTPSGGRWPANAIFDEAAAAGLGHAARYFYVPKPSTEEKEAGLDDLPARKVNDGRQAAVDNPFQRGETGRRNTHISVKPIDLMRYLVRLTATPSGGAVLDPFMGSGTTGIACVLENRPFHGIDKEAENVEIARKRIDHWRRVGRQ